MGKTFETKSVLKLKFVPSRSPLKVENMPWLGSSLGRSVVPVCQGCVFYSPSGNIQANNKCINKWNNKSMFLSLCKTQ